MRQAGRTSVNSDDDEVVRVRSTMQNVPLLISRILDYGSTVYADSEVVTWTPEGPRRSSYGDLGKDCRRLANALRRLGVDGDQRVATFMWNNEEHLELYLAVPSMGAVLHALNIRLFPEQLVYVANHAEDQIVVVDNSLAAPAPRGSCLRRRSRPRRGSRRTPAARGRAGCSARAAP